MLDIISDNCTIVKDDIKGEVWGVFEEKLQVSNHAGLRSRSLGAEHILGGRSRSRSLSLRNLLKLRLRAKLIIINFFKL